MGRSLAAACDVNGDGFDDVLIGADRYDGAAGQDSGQTYLFLGTGIGLAAEPSQVLDIEVAQAHFGHALTGAGDVNADGFSDVLIGAHN